MNTKGLKSLLKGLLVGVMTILSSCQQDDNTSPVEQNEAHAHHNTIRTVSAGDIPEVMDFLRTKSNDQLQFVLTNDQGVYDGTRNHTEDLSLTTPLLDQIKQATNGYGKSSYSFKLIEEETKEGVYFLNLIVKEYGDMLYMYILKYVPSQDWLDTYQGDFSLGSFKGEIYVYSETGRYVAVVNLDNGVSVSSEGRANDECPDPTDPDNPDGNSGGSPSGDGGSDGSTTSGTGPGSSGSDIPIDITAEFGWRCNWRNQLHANPNDCNNPGMGGEWVILIDDAHRSMINDVVCPPPNNDCDVDCEFGVGPNCECLPEDTEEVETIDVPTTIEINPGQILRDRLGIETDSPEDLLLSDNPYIEEAILDLLSENSWNDDDLAWVNDLLETLLITGIEDFDEFNYPGIDEGFHFEWWLDKDFINENISFDLLDEGLGDLTAREKVLVVLYPIQALIIKNNKEPATLETVDRFGFNGRNEKSDAFRHAFFNAMNANDAGRRVANLFSDAHESEVPTNLILEKEMDLFNNEVGLDIGDDASIFVSDQELSDQVWDALTDGELRFLDPLGPIVPPNFGIISTTVLIATF